MNGVGPRSLEKLRALADAGGWLDSGDYWSRFGYVGNRLPLLVCRFKVVESFGYCRLDAKGEENPTRIGYRLTDAGRDLLSREEGDSKE
jgi:hypothetical protein